MDKQRRVLTALVVAVIFVLVQLANLFLFYQGNNYNDIKEDMIKTLNNDNGIDEININPKYSQNITSERSSIINVLEENSDDKNEFEDGNVNIKNTFILPTRNLIKEQTGVAMCALVKDEEAYLEEWIDYHLGIGFEHIFIFDNSDEYNMKDWHKNKNIIREKVSISHFPGRWAQEKIYNNCVKNKTLGKYHWTAFWDIDEFLVLKTHHNVVDLVQEYCKSGSLQINWYIFGPNEQKVYEPLPVTKRFQYRHTNAHNNTKIIVRTSDFVSMKNPHSAELKNGTAQHDTQGNLNFGTKSATNPNKPMDVVALHHYRYKSRREFWYRSCVRKRVSGFKGTKCSEDLSKLESIPQTFDDSAWKLLKQHVPKYGIFDEWSFV